MHAQSTFCLLLTSRLRRDVLCTGKPDRSLLQFCISRLRRSHFPFVFIRSDIKFSGI